MKSENCGPISLAGRRRRAVASTLFLTAWLVGLGGCSDEAETTGTETSAGTVAAAGSDTEDKNTKKSQYQRDDRITAMTATELQSATASGELTAAAVTSAFLERIERLDKASDGPNAVLEINPDALAIARKLDAQRAAGVAPGLLHGVPVLLKANIDTADQMATSAGSLALANHRATTDAHVVSLLRDAGAVILGKTNLSEWANFRSTRSTSGWSSLGGQTHNPWRVSHNPCGSSSGSAAAVAARLAPLALGTETNGSIVCPAGASGVLGLKPTMGRVSRFGVIPIAQSMDMVGPMARNSVDLALLMRVIDGSDPRDRVTNLRFKKYNILTPNFDGTLKGQKIGVWRGYTGAGTNPAVDALLDEQVARLVSLGAEVIDPVEMSVGEYGERAYQVMLYEFREGINAYLAGVTAPGAPKNLSELIAFNAANADQVLPHFDQDILQAAEAVTWTNVEYGQALASLRKEANVQLEGALQRHQLTQLVSVTNGPAWKTDLGDGDDYTISSSTLPAITGHPHLTVPMGLVDGLPIGLSMMTFRANEFRLLELSAGVEGSREPLALP